MLERLQSVLKSVKDSKAPSLMAHRFVTVRRGSPAARSGHIQPGDQLKAVDSRPVDGLQHRDLSQILRRAGNVLRLSITPRQKFSSVSDEADLDLKRDLIKGPRGRSKQDESRFYSVDLERGPTGFGFSLRGGSEYNMGLYVLGLMEGGPAQRSNKIQVSDQLVEINRDSTAGMTHSQAVEQIRRGGHQIHLVLKKGNGYVPDYGPEEGAFSSSPHTEEQGPVTMTTAALSRRSRGGDGAGGGGGERRRERKAETKPRTGGGPPDLDLDLVEEEARVEEERRRRKRVEEEEKKERSQTIKQRRRDDQNQLERRSRSRSLPKTRADAPQPAKHAGSSAAALQAPFSFLMPMDDDQHPSVSQSSASFSEIVQSAARDVSVSSWRQGGAPGPWLKPSSQRLTQVQSRSWLSGRGLAGGLSL